MQKSLHLVSGLANIFGHFHSDDWKHIAFWCNFFLSGLTKRYDSLKYSKRTYNYTFGEGIGTNLHKLKQQSSNMHLILHWKRKRNAFFSGIIIPQLCIGPNDVKLKQNNRAKKQTLVIPSENCIRTWKFANKWKWKRNSCVISWSIFQCPHLTDICFRISELISNKISM